VYGEALFYQFSVPVFLQFRWLPSRLLHLNKDGFAVLEAHEIWDAVAVGLDKFDYHPPRPLKACLYAGLDFGFHLKNYLL
jgi:hypothetical protein